MGTFIIFFGFTQKGIEQIKESPSRVEEAKKIVQSMGGKVISFYGLMGMPHYDTLLIVEAPDDEVVARAALLIGSKGNVRTTTVRAYNEADYKRVLGSLP